jgi:hypothetical protein
MTPLRQRMLEDMQIRNLAASTQRSYAWGQTLMHHPHLHCVVPGGGLSPDGTRWIACRPGFFLPVRVLSRLFRRVFLDALQEAFDTGQLHGAGSLQALADPSGFAAHLQPTRQTDWVVYAKPPFAGPHQVLQYVGRYTHRVAIANHRLLDMDDGHVRFRYKNYRANSRRGTTSHVLPDTRLDSISIAQRPGSGFAQRVPRRAPRPSRRASRRFHGLLPACARWTSPLIAFVTIRRNDVRRKHHRLRSIARRPTSHGRFGSPSSLVC